MAHRQIHAHALRTALCLLTGFMVAGCCGDAQAAAKPVKLVFAYQPMALPSGAVVATVQRDRILRRELARMGFELRMLPSKNGSEAVALLMSGGAHISTLGDMPLLKAATEMPLYAVALVKQNYATVVGPKGLLPSDLKGKRIGNSHGTSGHFALMKTLSSARLSESDALLVPMEVTEMEDALLKGRIDAYAAWSPAPEMTIGRYPDRFSAIGKQKSLAFVVMSKPLVDAHPDLSRELTAALARAITWLRDGKNLERAAAWNVDDIKALQGARYRPIDQARLASDIRADLAAIRHTPRLPRGIDADGSSLSEEFAFLKKLGKVPPAARWSTVKGIFLFDAADRASRNARKHELSRFDYDN